jgi:NADPH:quinone reductase-like Zn-dependent oxidoreductase
LASPAERERRSAELFSWVHQGVVRVRIAKEFPLEAADDAHRLPKPLD